MNSPVLSRRAWLAAAVAASVLQAGCAALHAPSATPALQGRMSVQIDADAHAPARQVSAGFDLAGDADAGTLELSGPLGATLAMARWQPGLVELKTGDGTWQRFASLQALSQAALGEPLPLQALFDWLRGRPWSGAASAAWADGKGFDQAGWQVQTDLLASAGQIVATRTAPAPRVTLRARLDRGAAP